MALPPEDFVWTDEIVKKWIEGCKNRQPWERRFRDEYQQEWPWPDLGLRCPSNKDQIVFGIDPARPGSDTVVKVACRYEIDGSVKLVKIYKDGTW